MITPALLRFSPRRSRVHIDIDSIVLTIFVHSSVVYIIVVPLLSFLAFFASFNKLHFVLCTTLIRIRMDAEIISATVAVLQNLS